MVRVIPGANEQKQYCTIITNIHRRVKFDLVGSEIKLAYKIWITYLLPSLFPPVNRGALHCIADPFKL
jgi:hypothetical protein